LHLILGGGCGEKGWKGLSSLAKIHGQIHRSLWVGHKRENPFKRREVVRRENDGNNGRRGLELENQNRPEK
jgi:hypothetical protein